METIRDNISPTQFNIDPNIMTIEEELKDEDWVAFNRMVLKAFDLEEYYLRISNSLLSMRQVRKTARKVNKKHVMINGIERQHDAWIDDSAFAHVMAAEFRQRHG